MDNGLSRLPVSACDAQRFGDYTLVDASTGGTGIGITGGRK